MSHIVCSLLRLEAYVNVVVVV